MMTVPWSTNTQAALTAWEQVKNSAGTFGGFDWFNPNNLPVYVFVYSGSAAPNIGSPVNLEYIKGIPAGAGANFDIEAGIACPQGIWVAVSVSSSSPVPPPIGLVLTTFYQ